MKYPCEQISLILQRFYRAFHIPVSLMEGNDHLFSYASIAFDPDPVLLYYEYYANEGELDSCSANYLNINGVFTGMLPVKDSAWRILLGPVGSQAATTFLLEQVLLDLHLPFTAKNKLGQWFRKTPVLPQYNFLSVLHFLDLILNDEDSTPSDAATRYNLEVAPNTPYLQESYHNTQEFEQHVIHSIEQGRPEQLLEELMLHAIDRNLQTGLDAKTDLQMLQYSFIASVTLSSRAAIAGGMDYDYALSLSDQYIEKMQHVESTNDLPPLMGSMMMDYAKKVKELRFSEDCSPLTRQILSYIQSRNGRRISVNEISDRLHRSTSYLSHTFTRDTGETIREAIARSTLQKAQELLLETSLRISEISEYLGFSSQPHFQNFFRRYRNMTPREFRSTGKI